MAARLAADEEARIVAFGSSITQDGYYLEPLTSTLKAAYPNASLDLIVRALPGFMAFWAAFRVQAVVDLEPDLAILEFAVNDHTLPSIETTSKAVEGMVRRLRAMDRPPDILFVYFMSRLVEAVGSQQAIIDVWERVARHYGIPSFDCSGLAEHLVQGGNAMWLDRWPGRRSWEESNRPIPLTRDLTHHTPAGGRLFGRHLADAVLRALQVPSPNGPPQPALPEPLERDHYAEAQTVYPSELIRDGWILQPVSDQLETQLPAMYFSELAAATSLGARLRFEFRGSHAGIWGFAAPGNLVAVDGKQLDFNRPDRRMSLPVTLLHHNEPAPHAVEVEVRARPVEIGAIDVVGSLRWV